MKKNKLKIHLFLIGILLFFIQCKQFNDEPSQPYSRFVVKTLNNEQVMANSKVVNKINKYKTIDKIEILELQGKSNLQGKLLHSDEFNFTIDTDFVKEIEDTETNYHSYSFPLYRDNPIDDKVENLLLTLNQDGEYDVLIVNYGFTKEEFENIGEETLDNSITTYTPIDYDISILNDEDILKTGAYWNCTTSWIMIEVPDCDCTNSDTHFEWVEFHTDCTVSYGNTSSSYSNDGNNENTGNGNTGSSSGSSSSTSSSENYIISTPAIPPTLDEQINSCLNVPSTSGTTPNGNCDYTDLSVSEKKWLINYLNKDSNCQNQEVSDFIRTSIAESCNSNLSLSELISTKRSCKKINKLFTFIPTLQSELIDLKSKTSESTERGKYKSSGNTAIQNSTVGSNGFVEMGLPYGGGKYQMIAHTHNSPATNTYSVFSYADFEAISFLLKNGKIDNSKFVYFLSTADGTNYAITIDKPNKFLSAFSTYGEPFFNVNKDLNREEQKQNYYDGDAGNNVDPLIQENSTDYVTDEKLLLDFLKNTNLGCSLFEVNDTFDVFTKVTHNQETDNIDPDTCN